MGKQTKTHHITYKGSISDLQLTSQGNHGKSEGNGIL